MLEVVRALADQYEVEQRDSRALGIWHELGQKARAILRAVGALNPEEKWE